MSYALVVTALWILIGGAGYRYREWRYYKTNPGATRTCCQGLIHLTRRQAQVAYAFWPLVLMLALLWALVMFIKVVYSLLQIRTYR